MSATAAAGPDTGRFIRPPPGGASDAPPHGSIITSMAVAEEDEDDGARIRGIPAAAAALVSTGGLEMTDRLISSVSILSCTTVTWQFGAAVDSH